jgi:hypothetical protein
LAACETDFDDFVARNMREGEEAATVEWSEPEWETVMGQGEAP